MVEFIVQPNDAFRLGDFLVESLSSPDWTEFRAAIAFVKRSGTKHVRGALAEFSKRATVNISVGIDSNGTSAEGLKDLISSVSGTGKLWIFHNANSSTFHPKIYLFKNSMNAELVIGSGNLTEGGLYTNYEANIRFKLDLKISQHRSILTGVEAALDQWSAPGAGICFALDDALLKKLTESGRVLPEALTREIEERGPDKVSNASSKGDSLFKATKVPPAPQALAQFRDVKRSKKAPPDLTASSIGLAGTATVRTFVMTLQNTDMGYGQKTKGTSPRSPEIFVPMQAVDADPAFWGWPNFFIVDNNWSAKHAKRIAVKKASRRHSVRPLEKMDRHDVKIRVAKTGSMITATIWYNPEKVDIRMRHKQLRAAGKEGDLLVFQKAAAGAPYEYAFEAVARTDIRFAKLDAACNIKVIASPKKRFGYI